MRNVWVIPVLISLTLGLHYGAQRAFDEGLLGRVANSSARKGRARRSGRGGTRKIQPVTLRGPGGKEVTLPQEGPVVVNVWLQGCADCMPRFRASQQLGLEARPWPQPVVNVAYGSADPSWAAEYGVAENLVIDKGSHVVMPLGISTFTTLVIDAEGVVRHTDFADREGFLDRLEQAMQEAKTLKSEAKTPAPAARKTPAKNTAPKRPKREAKPALKDARILGAMALLVVALLLKLASSDFAGSGAKRAVDDGPWADELVSSGKRCHHCGGRFDDPREIGRCGSCHTAYHEVCLGKAEVCSNIACSRYMKPL
jgi:hypothetical protein